MSTIAASQPAKRRRGSLQRTEAIWGIGLALPWLIGFVVWTAGPMLASIVLSLTSWDLLSPPKFVGLANYATLIGNDPSVFQSLKVTTLYAFFALPLNLALGLFVAVLLNQKVRFQSFIRTVYYLPAVVSGVAVALLWSWIFSPDFGMLNTLLSYVGITGPGWLASETWVLPSFILMSLWGVGGAMIIYLAGLQGIPTEMYEAAQVDGASDWVRFWSITIPMVSPVLLFNLIIGIIQALQEFVRAYIMTNGGPHDASLFFMLYLYRNAFEYFKMGYASSLAWVLFIYIMVLTVLVLRSSAAWVYYEGQIKGK